jgi:hypothetical protein
MLLFESRNLSVGHFFVHEIPPNLACLARPHVSLYLSRSLQSGLPGVVLATDTAKWQVQVQLDSDPRPKWLPPGKLEMDLVRE